MGVTDEEAEAWTKLGDNKEGGKLASPAHPVRLSRAFYIGEREVRVSDFLAIMKRNPGNTELPENTDPNGPVLRYCPWLDCVEFCNRLSEREGRVPAYKIAGATVTLVPDATGYRLPTEAEWEFACRAGTTTLWYFGWTAEEMAKVAVTNMPAAQGKLRAAQDQANPFGLHAMYGSSSEWCWDSYAPGYYRECLARGVVVDPLGPPQGNARIVRGGALFASDNGDTSLISSAARVARPLKEDPKWEGFGRIVLPVPNGARAAPSRPPTIP